MTLQIPPLHELLLNFESLGDNCEFGLVQRHAGLEPLGLFRFSFSSMSQLLRAVKNRFDKIAELDLIDVRVAKNNELVVHLLEYGFYYHSGKHAGEVEIETLRRDEQKKLAFLIRRLIGTVTTGEKIFIRKGEKTKTCEQAKVLLSELRAYGAPATLLWVTEADHENPPGSVRLLEPGLMHGRIDSFAPYLDAHSISFTSWIDVCENAYSLWKATVSTSTYLPPPIRVDQSANLLYGGNRDVNIIALPHEGRTEIICGSFPLRDPYRPTLCRHLLTGVQEMVGLRVGGLQAGALYTFSVWARLSGERHVQPLKIAAPGSATIRARRPNSYQRRTWQRLEITAHSSPSGILFLRLMLQGEPGAVVETANWRLEAGLLVGARENPSDYPPLLLEPQLRTGGPAREKTA